VTGRARFERAALVLLIATAAIAWRGYRFAGSNQSIQVPALLHASDPALYAQDPLLRSFDGYATYFFKGLAPLLRFVDVEPLYFGLYVLAMLTAFAAVLALAERLGLDDAGKAIALLLYAAQLPSLGAEFAYWPRLTHAHVAQAALLWCFPLALSGRWLAAFGLAGLMLDFHALYAVHVLALLGFERLLARRFAELGRGLALAALLGAPVLLWVLSAGAGDVGGEGFSAWLELLRQRSGPHAFPTAVPVEVYVRYGLFLALGALALVRHPAETEARRRLIGWCAAVFALCAIGYVFAEWIPTKTVLRAQLFRSTRWLTLLASFPIAALAVSAWRRGGIERASAIFWLLGLVLAQPGWLAIGLALFLIADPRRPSPAFSAAVWGALILAALTRSAPVPERMGLQLVTDLARDVFVDPLVLAMLAPLLLWRAARAQESELFSRLALGAGVLAAVFFVLPRVARASQAGIRGEAWTEAQLWVAANTPKDAVILTPPHREGFRVFSRRAVVGEWKDGTQQFFSDPFTWEWKKRMADLGGDSHGYDGYDATRIRELADRYGATFAVRDAEAPLPFEKLHENSEFAVYAVPRRP